MTEDKTTAVDIAAGIAAGLLALAANAFGCLVAIGSAAIGFAVLVSLVGSCVG